MTNRKKKRVRKQRGSQHHGYGKVNPHRKSGDRGGVGRSGVDKHQWLKITSGKREPLGKHGFTRPQRLVEKVETINVSHVEAMLLKFKNEGIVEKQNNLYELNLTELGYDKLLAQGNIRTPMKITIEKASKRAIEKIEEAGGALILEEEQK